MRSLAYVALAAALLLAAPGARAGQGAYPQTEEALQAEYDSLNWVRDPGSYRLEPSNSTLTLDVGQSLLLGDDAQRVMFLMNGVEFPGAEAVLFEGVPSVLVTFEFIDDGYVSDGDWTDVDADALLEEMRKGYEAENAERREKGIEPLILRGWLEKPRYDADSGIVYWVLSYDEGDTVTLNGTALRLSRYGYEQITWVGKEDQYGPMGGILKAALDNHVFDDGHRYADYVEGDKLAGYSIAGLVAAVTGVRSGKGLIAVIVAFGLAFLEKGWILAVVVLGGAGVAFKRLAGMKNRSQSDPPTVS